MAVDTLSTIEVIKTSVSAVHVSRGSAETIEVRIHRYYIGSALDGETPTWQGEIPTWQGDAPTW